MNGKEFLKDSIQSFFVIVTLINVATFILGSIYQPEARFGYDAFLSPLVYGVFSMIPVVIMYSKKELTMKQLMNRKVLQLFSIEVILVVLGFGKNSVNGTNTKVIISFCFSVFVIYILVHIICWLLDSHTAKELTEELQHYQGENS